VKFNLRRAIDLLTLFGKSYWIKDRWVMKASKWKRWVLETSRESVMDLRLADSTCNLLSTMEARSCHQSLLQAIREFNTLRAFGSKSWPFKSQIRISEKRLRYHIKRKSRKDRWPPRQDSSAPEDSRPDKELEKWIMTSNTRPLSQATKPQCKMPLHF